MPLSLVLVAPTRWVWGRVPGCLGFGLGWVRAALMPGDALDDVQQNRDALQAARDALRGRPPQ